MDLLTVGVVDGKLKVRGPLRLGWLARRIIALAPDLLSDAPRRAEPKVIPGLPPGVPDDLRRALASVADVFGELELVEVRTPRHALADLIRGTRRRGDRESAAALRMEFNERAGIREFDGGMDRRRAELAAAGDALEHARISQRRLTNSAL